MFRRMKAHSWPMLLPSQGDKRYCGNSKSCCGRGQSLTAQGYGSARVSACDEK